MKKISSILIAMTVFLSASFGQAKQENAKTNKKQVASAAAVPKATAKTQTNAASVKKTAAVPEAKPVAQAPQTKKDGTPDKRFKANKIAKPSPDLVLKKDGTPDKRYKVVAKKP